MLQITTHEMVKKLNLYFHFLPLYCYFHACDANDPKNLRVIPHSSLVADEISKIVTTCDIQYQGWF